MSPSSEGLLGALAEGLDFKALAEAGAEDAAGVLLPGSRFAVLLAAQVGGALWEHFRGRSERLQRDDLDSLASLPADRASAVVRAALRAAPLDPQPKSCVESYLTAVPMAVRQAVTRPGDGGRPQTLASQLPRSREDTARFVPPGIPRFKPGDRIEGHDYRLEHLLGQGGFAEVWKAKHAFSELQPPVALKFCLDPSLESALKNEIRMLSALRDAAGEPHFVQLLHTAYSADPPFLVYEYVDGGDLLSWMADQGDARPKTEQCLRVLAQIAEALARAHACAIVHRDLKPANVLMTREGQVKLADFGIGALFARAHAARTPARPGTTGATLVRGAHTPLYAAPEWTPGDPATPKVDVYAFGIIAWQLLTGDLLRPIPPSWREELADRRTPESIIDIVDRCLARPERRIADGAALRHALRAATENEAPPKREPRPQANYCIECGARVDETMRFCTECGTPVAP